MQLERANSRGCLGEMWWGWREPSMMTTSGGGCAKGRVWQLLPPQPPMAQCARHWYLLRIGLAFRPMATIYVMGLPHGTRLPGRQIAPPHAPPQVYMVPLYIHLGKG